MRRASQATILLMSFALLGWTMQSSAQTSGIVDDPFIRGDANGDGEVNFTDVMTSLDYLFRRGATPACMDAADANDDGGLNLTDPVVTILFLFAGGAPLPPPTGSPGADPTPDELGC